MKTILKSMLATSQDTASVFLRFIPGIVLFAHGAQHMTGWLGLSIHKLQVGAALNLDEYGKETKIRHNLGIIIRTEL